MPIKDTFVKMVAGAKKVGKKVLFHNTPSTGEMDKAIKRVNEINADKKMPPSVRTEALKKAIIDMKIR